MSISPAKASAPAVLHVPVLPLQSSPGRVCLGGLRAFIPMQLAADADEPAPVVGAKQSTPMGQPSTAGRVQAANAHGRQLQAYRYLLKLRKRGTSTLSAPVL